MALGEDQVDHGEHGPQPVGQLGGAGDPVGDVVGLDLLLGPDDPLGHRGLGHQERLGDLGGLEAGDEPEREGDVRLRGRAPGGST